MWSDCHDRRKSTRLARRKYKFPKVAPFRERAHIQLTARKWPRRYTKITGGVSGSIISLHPSQDLRAYQGVHATRSTAKCICAAISIYPDFRRRSRCLWSVPPRLSVLVCHHGPGIQSVSASSWSQTCRRFFTILRQFRMLLSAVREKFLLEKRGIYRIRAVKWVEVEI